MRSSAFHLDGQVTRARASELYGLPLISQREAVCNSAGKTRVFCRPLDVIEYCDLRIAGDLPTLHVMHGPEDVDIVLQWGHRLKLFAELQGAYYERLRSCGFDEDHAFQLVREWTVRTVGWASSNVELELFGQYEMHAPPPPGAAPAPPDGMGSLHALPDPTNAPSDEPYLLIDEDASVDTDADAA